MSTPCPSPAAPKSRIARDSRRTHRRLVIIGGSLAIIGAALAAFVDPAWAALAAVGGLTLLLYPETNCCAH